MDANGRFEHLTSNRFKPGLLQMKNGFRMDLAHAIPVTFKACPISFMVNSSK